MALEALSIRAGSTVVLYLHSPREKHWGLLLAVDAAGVVLRGLDLRVFDEWMRQEARGDETMIGPSTVFYPMHRVERMERDETIGSLASYADRFAREVGRTVRAAMGAPEEE